MRARWLSWPFAAVFSFAASQTAHADLALDSTFASDGIAEVNIASDLDSARDIAVQDDGKYVLAGMSRQTPGDQYDYAAVVRVDDTGTLDPDFGSGGKVIVLPGGTPLNYGGGDARAVAIQPVDHKIVVAGTWNVNDGSGRQIFVMRLMPDGSPDPEFGTANGVAIVDLPWYVSDTETDDIALQSSGDILVSGSLQRPFTDPEGFILRLTSSGARDTSFATDGVFTMAEPNNPGSAFGWYALQVGDGDVIVATGGLIDAVVVKLSADGAPDTSFDGDGVAGFNYASKPAGDFTMQTIDNVNGLALQSDGKILLTGSTQHEAGGSNAIFVARVTTAGALDPTFGSGGWALLPDQPQQETAYSVVVRTSGDLVVSGVGFNPVQVSPGGTAFSALPGGFAPQSINALALLDDGRVVGGGEQNISGLNYEMVAIRLDVTDLPDPVCEGPGGGLLCGDMNGDCSIKAGDALTTLRMAVGTTEVDLKADVDGNGTVSASDALKTLRIAVGIDEPSGACNT